MSYTRADFRGKKLRIYVYGEDGIFDEERFLDEYDRDLETGRWIIPGESTLTPPPKTGEHEVAVFKNNKWEIVPDYRGETVYMGGDFDENTEEYKQYVVEEIGPLPPGASLVPIIGDKKKELRYRYKSLRGFRTQKLAETDYLLSNDYDISPENLEKVKAYRTALRNITKLEGAPWDGGGPLTPWPEYPTLD